MIFSLTTHFSIDLFLNQVWLPQIFFQKRVILQARNIINKIQPKAPSETFLSYLFYIKYKHISPPKRRPSKAYFICTTFRDFYALFPNQPTSYPFQRQPPKVVFSKISCRMFINYKISSNIFKIFTNLFFEIFTYTKKKSGKVCIKLLI